MTLQEFRNLHQKKKVETIKGNGCFISQRQEDGIDIILYQLYSFYAEVYFDGNRTSGGTQIECFEEKDLPELYLNNINITELKKLL